MLSVTGMFRNGVAQPAQPLKGREGQIVIITFLEDYIARLTTSSEEDAAWDVMMQLVEACAVETGIDDLAHQHDHYLYGKPKGA